ncbi:DUF4920 domain-containing protein [Arenicella xantha]|uniref:Uncharacterized protein DUF4920 n=1 Tax=Arenicella xantha TaxID=644221 RepID=A0A395JNQ8_9GAMM|nr:DUF4920 domain-containing protein [Arenicella xantha]RBP51194.1 uncharacterized protein DUF4920 [Arenicella xantha]
MTKYTVLLVLLLCVFSVSSEAAVRLSEPVIIDAESETFAKDLSTIESLPTSLAPTGLASVLAAPDAFLNTPIALQLEVAKVCQKKGCFFIGQQDGQHIRVSFQDYEFFVPSDIGGRTVELVGHIVARTVSPQQAKHLSKDLGTANAVASGPTYEFVALSARVFHAAGDPQQ